MFIIRQAIAEDAPTLLKLAKMVHFINLPADPEIIRSKIVRSRKSFADQLQKPRDREFMFVLEDTATGNVVGTSSVITCLGWPGRPHTFMVVRKREHYSEDLQTGQVHLTLQLGTDESGPSEIGGLVLGPSYRGHELKLGMTLSLVRFHFIGRRRDWFADRIVAEMMGPLTADSRNHFWDALGRRFINLSFAEADLFCQRSKEFITSLFPTQEIYVSLLPPEVRNQIGKVGSETEPAKKLLESVGFRDRGQVDPFDGGPYLEARVDDIELITTTRTALLGKPVSDPDTEGFVSVHRDEGFRAVRTPCADAGETVSISKEAAEALRAVPGDEIAFTPLPKASGKRPRKTRAAIPRRQAGSPKTRTAT